MKKLLIISFTFLFVLFFSVHCYAIDMSLFESINNSINNGTADNTSLDTIDDEENDDILLNTINNQANYENENIIDSSKNNLPLNTSNESSSATLKQSSSETFLTPSNIVNIVLIAVSIVLIFLAIAILVKIK